MVKEVYHRVEESEKPALLVVAGDPGVGKSRLGWEFAKYTDGLSTTCRWHAGKCVSYGEGVAYYALAEAIRSRLETTVVADSDSSAPADTSALIDQALAVLMPSAEERRWVAPRLGALLGSVTSTFQREELFAAWTTFFERVGGGVEPVVMLIDDAQYADAGLVKFVEHLMAAASFPCLVVLLTRPELLAANPSLVTNRRATVLHLEQLTDSDMAALVDGLVEGLPEGVRDELVARAEGVPTFAVETVRALIDRDLVVPRGGSYVLRDPENLDLSAIGAPASLQALISARLDTLSLAERRVVDKASVAGDSIEPSLLRGLCRDIVDLDEVLAHLVHAQILRVEASRLSSEAGRYQFVQTAVRQVAYGTLSRRDRKQTHLDVAEALALLQSDELAPVLAQHYVAAVEAVPDGPDVPELTNRAIDLLRQASTRATSLGSPTEAVGHLGRALDLATDPAARADLQLAQAQACDKAGSFFDEQMALAREASATFATVGNRDGEALAVAALSRALARGPADYQGALDLIQPWYERLRDEGAYTPVYAEVFDVYLLVLSRLGGGNFDLTVEQFRIAERLGDESGVVRAFITLTVLANQSGSFRLSAAMIDLAVAAARRSRGPAPAGRRPCQPAGAAVHGRAGPSRRGRQGGARHHDPCRERRVPQLLPGQPGPHPLGAGPVGRGPRGDAGRVDPPR